MVRPTAKPSKPGTAAATCSQSRTRASFAPRPRTMHTTPVATTCSCLRDDAGAVCPGVEALDLPDVWFDALLLLGADRLDDERRADLGVVAMPVAAAALELGRGGWYEQLVEETPPVLVQPAAQLREALSLAAVQLRVAFGVVAHEDLGESRVEGLDVAREVLAVLELELRLARALDRHCERVGTGLGLPSDRGAELLVDEDAGGFLRCAPTGPPARSLRRSSLFTSMIPARTSSEMGGVARNRSFSNDPRWSNASR